MTPAVLPNPDDQPPQAHLASTSTLPIAQISPTSDRLHEYSIHGVVVLVWPYSSATKSLSLLLAEPDFRLRRQCGQIKAVFHGSVAEKVAEARVGISDEAVLSLSGAKLADSNAVVSCAAWDIHFDDRVFLEIFRSSKHLLTVDVRPLQAADENAAAPSTPRGCNAHPKEPDVLLNSWSSPAFSRRPYLLSGTFTDGLSSPFAEEDGFIPGKGRKRLRLSMRSSEWRVVDEPESPAESYDPVDWIGIEAELSEQESQDEVATEGASKGRTPTLELPVPDPRGSAISTTLNNALIPIETSALGKTGRMEESEQEDKRMSQPAELSGCRSFSWDSGTRAKGIFDHLIHLPTDTPRLHPIPSPGLPVPSPLVSSNSSCGYFTPFVTTAHAPHSRDLATDSQMPTPTGEGHISSQVWQAQQAPPQPRTVPSNTREGSKDRVLTQGVLSPRASGTDVEKAWPASAGEATKLLCEARAQLGKATEQPGHNVEDEQTEFSAVAAAAEQKGAITDVAGRPGKWPVTDGKMGSDTSQRRSEGCRHTTVDAESALQEEELDDEGESVEEVAELQQEHLRERFDTKASPEADRAHTNDLDLDEIEEERTKNEKNMNSDIAGVTGTALSARKDLDDLGYNSNYEEADGSDIDADGGVTNSPGDSQRGYVSESDCSEDSGSYSYLEFGSESISDEEEIRRPHPSTSIPEIIVLDSDSDDEPQPRSNEQPNEQPKCEVSREREQGLSYMASDEYLSSVGSAAETELISVSGASEAKDYADGEGLEGGDVRVAQGQRSPLGPLASVLAAGSQGEETRYERVGAPELMDGDHGSWLAAPGHSHGADHHAQLLDAKSEASADGFGMAIDARLAETSTGAPLPPVATGHRTGIEQTRTEHSMEPTVQGRPTNRNVWLDGAAYPIPFSDIEPIHQLPTVLEGQMATGKLQGDHYSIGDTMVNGAVHTPQCLSYAAVDPGLRHQINVPLDPARGVEPTESSSELVPASNRLRVDEKGVEEPGDRTDRDLSPAVSTRYFSLLAESGNDRQAHVSRPGNPEEQEQLNKYEPTCGEVDRDTFFIARESHLLVRAGLDLPHTAGEHNKGVQIAPLVTLAGHSDELVDTISVICEAPASQVMREGDTYILAFRVTDPSMAGCSLPVKVLASAREALPCLTEGDAMLLRGFQVKATSYSVELVSVNVSTWVILHCPDSGMDDHDNVEERSYAADIQQWYRELGASMVADSQLQASIEGDGLDDTEECSSSFSGDETFDPELPSAHDDSPSLPRRRKRRKHGKIIVHELRDGRRYAQVGSSPGNGSIHELRDGTVYANL